jgi:hypothetical protein
MKRFTVLLTIPLLLGNEGGCDGPEVRLLIPTIPQHLMHCLPDPLKGKNFQNLNNRQIAHIIVAYKTAHADCEAKINHIRNLYSDWLEKNK